MSKTQCFGEPQQPFDHELARTLQINMYTQHQEVRRLETLAANQLHLHNHNASSNVPSNDDLGDHKDA